MNPLESRPLAIALLVLSVLLGGSSLALFGIFLWRGSLDVVNLDLGYPWLYVWDTALCWVFFLQHSLMVRRSFRERWMAAIPAYARAACYTCASGVALLVVVLLWQESPLYHDRHTGFVVQAMVAGWVLALGIGVWSLAVLRVDILGLDDVVDHLRGRTPAAAPPFVARGPYRLVRHPLYLACLLLIWAGPGLTADRLLFDILWTVWIFVGAKLEERDLTAEFGEDYARYAQGVGMILPWRAAASPYTRQTPRDESEPRP